MSAEPDTRVLADRVARLQQDREDDRADKSALRQEIGRLQEAVNNLAVAVAAIKPINVIMQSALVAIVGGAAAFVLTKGAH